MSNYGDWSKSHCASEGLIFPENIGPYLSIDETALSQGELYTIVTNKQPKGKKGTLVAIIEGTKSERVIEVITQISAQQRNQVKEITLDLAGNMSLIAKKCFPNATQVIDRFHVQQLANEALQELRIKHRWEAIDQENQAIQDNRLNNKTYQAEILLNGDSLKQLLARSRYLLYKSSHNWSEEQMQRASVLFEKYPDIKKGYEISEKLRWIFSHTDSKMLAFTRLAKWSAISEQSNLKTFNTVIKTINTHHVNILNYFDNRSTNASAESFNAKIKAFRAQYRGVKDINFFLFRLMKLYA